MPRLPGSLRFAARFSSNSTDKWQPHRDRINPWGFSHVLEVSLGLLNGVRICSASREVAARRRRPGSSPNRLQASPIPSVSGIAATTEPSSRASRERAACLLTDYAIWFGRARHFIKHTYWLNATATCPRHIDQRSDANLKPLLV